MIAASIGWWIAGILTAWFGLALVVGVIVGGILRSRPPAPIDELMAAARAMPSHGSWVQYDGGLQTCCSCNKPWPCATYRLHRALEALEHG